MRTKNQVNGDIDRVRKALNEAPDPARKAYLTTRMERLQAELADVRAARPHEEERSWTDRASRPNQS